MNELIVGVDGKDFKTMLKPVTEEVVIASSGNSVDRPVFLPTIFPHFLVLLRRGDAVWLLSGLNMLNDGMQFLLSKVE